MGGPGPCVIMDAMSPALTPPRSAAVGAAASLCLALAGCAVAAPAGGLPAGPAATASTSPSGASAGAQPVAGDQGEPSASAGGMAADATGAVTVALTGDVLWHDSLVASVKADAKAAGRTGFYTEPLFAQVKPVLQAADVAVCQEETPIQPPGVRSTGYPTFGAPYESAQALADLGFDACTTASNHSLDKGEKGLRNTLATLRGVGILPVGTGADASDVAPRIVTTASGVRVAFVAGTWALNGDDNPPGWMVNNVVPEDMIARARAARAAGAQIVIANVHAGTEYTDRPNADQTSIMKALALSGEFDLVYGHHPHTVQPWTKIGGVWVVYSVGNLVAQMRKSEPTSMEGIVAQFRFEPDAGGRYRVARASYVPLLVTFATAGAPARVLDVSSPDAAGFAPASRIRQARERIRSTVLAFGATGIEED